jgi:co-chaperonin GroES (HSP10)
MLKALGYRLLIKPDEIKTTTESGIEVVLDRKLEKIAIQTGTVIDIGPIAFKDYNKSYSSEAWCSVGDKVLFSKYGGKWIYDPETFDGFDIDKAEQYIIIDDSDVLCRIGE